VTMDRAALETFLRDCGWTYKAVAGGREFVLDCRSCGKASHLYINAETTQYECKVCGAKGNLATLRQLVGDATGNGHGGQKASRPSARPVDDLTARALSNHAALPPEARAYLDGRGLGPAIDSFKFGYRRDGSGQEWITIPYWRNGKVTQIRRRAMPGTPCDTEGNKYQGDAGVPVELYNLDTLDGRYVLLVEGELKAALLSLAMPELSVVGLPGTTFKDEWKELFRDAERVYLCLDAAEQNYEAAVARIAEALGPKRCRVVDVPEKPDDFVRARGVEALRDLMLKAHSLELPAPKREGDVFRFPAPHGVEIKFSRCEEHGLDMKAWVELARPLSHGRFFAGALNLTSGRARDDLQKRLERAVPGQWGSMVEHVCTTVIEQVRQVGETVMAYPAPFDEPNATLLERLLMAGELTEFYGPPESVKGYFVLFVLQALEHEITLPNGLVPRRRVRALYADWESNLQAFQHRLARVQRGLGIQARPLPYRQMRRPLHEEISDLRRDLDRYQADVAVFDSYIMGCGGEPETNDAMVRFFTPLAALTPRITPIAINHVSRASTERAGKRSPFGGIAGEGMVRSAWEMRRSQDSAGNEVIFSLRHAKVNERHHEPAMGFRLVFESDQVRLLGHDVDEHADLNAALPLADRILKVLRNDRLESEAIAERCDATEDAVRKELSRLRKRGKVSRFDEHGGDGGRGKAAFWGLRA
jgi:hypothetical protein